MANNPRGSSRSCGLVFEDELSDPELKIEIQR